MKAHLRERSDVKRIVISYFRKYAYNTVKNVTVIIIYMINTKDIKLSQIINRHSKFINFPHETFEIVRNDQITI